MDEESPRGASVQSTPWDLDGLVRDLRAARIRWRQSQTRNNEIGARAFPSRTSIETISSQLRSALFPLRLGPAEITEQSEDFFVGQTLNAALNALMGEVRVELGYLLGEDTDSDGRDIATRARQVVGAFAQALPEIRGILDSDVEAAFRGDPAARSVDEVLICYPGIIAIIHHRMAHVLYRLGVRLTARIISEVAHSLTGVDIHPGAQIGPAFFIDHGTGVVIGETAIIGSRVTVYQAVTLGAKSFPTDETGIATKDIPRHPIIEDDVVIYAGATILGRVTIGRGSLIGGNVWLTRSVPPESRISQASSRRNVLKADGEHLLQALDHADAQHG